MADLFSKRLGIEVPEKEITVRNDAPNGLRAYIPEIYYGLGKYPSDVRPIVCRTLRIAPDEGNWSERPNIAMEVQNLLMSCEWYRVYDIIEALASKLINPLNPSESFFFHDEINSYFKENGIGWKLENGLIESRGDEEFETAILEVEVVLDERSLPTAKNEIKEAIKCISRRPEPDITGAIQHSLAALECVSRKATGDEKMTLGELIKTHPGIVPAPLDKAISMIWGFSSEQGRHLREGRDPQFEEAELMVHLSATLCTYLGKKHIEVKVAVSSDDLPF